MTIVSISRAFGTQEVLAAILLQHFNKQITCIEFSKEVIIHCL